MNPLVYPNKKFNKLKKNFLECNENGSKIYQKLWNKTKAMLRRKFITEVLHEKQKDLMFHLKILAKQK
jgi:hypothetical protein